VKPISWMLMAALLGAAGASACDRTPVDDNAQPASVEPTSNQLPPLVLRDDTKNLLLTWVNDHGDFRVVTRIADVPETARGQVRVVVTTEKAGTGPLFYVADLRQAKPDGTYPVTTMTRAAWDEVGASRRQARLEALAPSARPSSMPPPAGAHSGNGHPSPPGASRPVSAVIYGAEWCGPCHLAARYLKSLGVTVVEKNIESDPLAAREMQTKINNAHLPSTTSIPVIDVGGQLLVGYNPQALQRAVKASRSAEPM